ncbi:MAG TPA: tail fiber domain-containing protein [Candidatus Saccharimonadales bacterium]
MEKPKTLPDTTRIVMVMPNGGASDKNLKKNVTEITTALDHIAKLRPVTWEWKNKHDDPTLQHGFIAQEIEAVFPDLVGERLWEDGTLRKFVFTDALIPYLVKALQEQRRQVKALTTTVHKLLEQSKEQPAQQ